MNALKSKPENKPKKTLHPYQQSAKKSAYTAEPSGTSNPSQGVLYSAGPAVSLGLPVSRKAAIGRQGDAYEKEADTVAEHVMRGSQAPAVSRIGHNGLGRSVQYKEAEEEEEAVQTCMVQRQAEDEEEPVQTKSVQRQEAEEEEETVQSRSISQGQSISRKAQAASSQAIHSKGTGKPMEPETRRTLETSMGVDLGDIRVHEDNAAHKSAADLKAHAFTYKNNIWLGQNQSQRNIRLMAHEATHVLQQGGVVRRKPIAISRVSPGIQGSWFGDAKGWVLKKVAEHAGSIPGFHLLTVILGRNPITEKPVERNAVNLTRGIMGLVPGGEKLFKHLQESGSIERAFKWFSKQIEKLNITWTVIKNLFGEAWEALSASDLLSPSKAFAKIKKIFMPPIIRIRNFAVAVGKKVMQFVFEGALRLAGPAGKKVMDVIGKGKETFGLIVKNPIGFLGNLLKAVGQGFKQFSANIWTHLKKGLLGWLFGTLSKAGITMPEKLNIKGILSLVLQILGLTYANMRVKLVKLLGEKTVGYLEQAFEFVKILVTEGLAGAWKKIVEYMGSLKDMVIGAIRNWVVTRIVKSAITKLATMFNPVGAIIQAIITIYNTVMFFIERAKQIMALANAVFDSIINIAKGKMKVASDYVEMTMARTIPVIISFLARLLGLGGIADKIKEVIKKIQAKVNKALDKVIGFIVKKAKKLFGKGKAVVQKGVEKVKGLFFPKKRLRGGEEVHTVDVIMSGKEHEILIHSSVSSVSDFIKEYEEKEKKNPDATLSKLIKDLDVKYSRWKQMPINNEAEKMKKSEEYLAIYNHMTKIVERSPSEIAVPLSKIDWKPMDQGRAKGVKADPLTINGPPGSKPQEDILGWNTSYEYNGERISYIKAHLLHHHLHGPGRRFNMTPTSNSINRLMYHRIEKQALEALGIRPKDKERQRSRKLTYETDVKYDDSKQEPLKNIAKRIEMKVEVKDLKTDKKIESNSWGEDNY